MICCLMNALGAVSQDIHFSQFNATPLNLNPALTGLFDGDYRFVLNRRNQWASITVPYNTYSGSFDMVLPTKDWKIKNLPEGIWGAGIVINNDKAGDSQLGLLEAKVSLSYTRKISKDSSMFLTFAIQPGISNKSFNYNNLQFDEQWDGDSFDPNRFSGEVFQRTSFTYLDLGFGTRWHYRLKARNNVNIGLSYTHFNKATETFLSNSSSQLSPKFAFHADGQFMVTDEVDLVPSWLYQRQNTFSEAIIGASGKYIINPEDNINFYLGVFVRFQDAVIPMVSMDYRDFKAGLSYDVNTSQLKTASNGHGGFELSVSYVMRKFVPLKPAKRLCPVYL